MVSDGIKAAQIQAPGRLVGTPLPGVRSSAAARHADALGAGHAAGPLSAGYGWGQSV